MQRLTLPIIAVILCSVPAARAGLVTSLGAGNWEVGGTWSGGLEPDIDDDVTVNHTVTITGTTAKAVNSLILNATLTHAANGTTDQSKRVTLQITAGATINTAGKIDVTGRGYSGGVDAQNGYGPGKGYKGAGRCGGGAGQGAQGGTGQYDAGSGGAGGTLYGSFLQPTDIGSGGGGTVTSGAPVTGGSGGGGIKLTAQSLTIDGSILANGNAGGWNAGRSAGAGAAGSIWLSVTNLSGTGLVQAKGGTTSPSTSYGTSGGGGGGGRISLYYTTRPVRSRAHWPPTAATARGAQA